MRFVSSNDSGRDDEPVLMVRRADGEVIEWRDGDAPIALDVGDCASYAGLAAVIATGRGGPSGRSPAPTGGCDVPALREGGGAATPAESCGEVEAGGVSVQEGG